MARTSAIISLVVVFVLAVIISNEVQASQCMSKCNNKCINAHKSNGVSCGVQCFVQCVESGNQKLSPEMKSKIATLKNKSINGAITDKDVEDELRSIALHMMLISEDAVLHDHQHKFGEKPAVAPKTSFNDDDDDDDDDDVDDDE